MIIINSAGASLKDPPRTTTIGPKFYGDLFCPHLPEQQQSYIYMGFFRSPFNSLILHLRQPIRPFTAIGPFSPCPPPRSGSSWVVCASCDYNNNNNSTAKYVTILCPAFSYPVISYPAFSTPRVQPIVYRRHPIHFVYSLPRRPHVK